MAQILVGHMFLPLLIHQIGVHVLRVDCKSWDSCLRTDTDSNFLKHSLPLIKLLPGWKLEAMIAFPLPLP